MSQFPLPGVSVSAVTQRVLAALLHVDGGPLIVARGPAGSGKTSLLHAVLAEFAARDNAPQVRLVTASPSSPVPFSALAALVPDRDTFDLTADRLVAELGTPEDGVRPIIGIDDAAHLDDASAALLHQVGLSGEVGLLFSIRDGQNMPPAITALLAAREHLTARVDPLTDSEIRSLVLHVLGGPLDDSSVHTLTEASRGNPLHIRELLTGALDAGVVRNDNGVWRFGGPLTISPLLEELILARLGPLDAEQRRVVELLSLAGSLSIRLLAETVRVGAVEALENRQVVTVSTTDEVSLIHPLYGEVVLTGVGRLTRQRRFAELASAEKATMSVGDAIASPAQNLRATVWGLRGGLELAPGDLLAAAQVAMKTYDPTLAAEVGRQAFERGSDGRAALIAAWGLATVGQHDEAITLLHRALGVTTDPWVRTACRLRLAEELWWWRHDLDGAVALLDASPGDENSALLTAQRGVFAVLDGDIETATATSAPLVDHPALVVRFVAAIAQTHALAASDRPEEALALAQRTFDEAIVTDEELLGDPNIHVVNQVMALLHGGRIDDARSLGELINDVASREPAPISQAWGALMSGFALVLSGDVERGSERLAQAESHWRWVDIPGIQRWAVAGRALADAALGKAATPQAVLAALDDLPAEGFRLYAYLGDLAVTWAAVSHNDTRLAYTWGRAALASASAPVHLAHVAHDLARLGVVEILRDVPVRSGGGTMSDARWSFVEGVLNDDAALLERSGETFAGCGAHLFAAEAFALAARIHKRAARRRDEVRLDGLCGRERQQCGSVTTPPLRNHPAGGPLSARELQIATMAAQGLTNRAIADRLIIGERTVETHLSHTYTKLGIRGRGDLASAELH